jgi:hypothetical protein
MSDKPDVDEDVVDELEGSSDELTQVVVVFETTWRMLIKIFPPGLQVELTRECLRDGPFIVIPRLMWQLVLRVHTAQTT